MVHDLLGLLAQRIQRLRLRLMGVVIDDESLVLLTLQNNSVLRRFVQNFEQTRLRLYCRCVLIAAVGRTLSTVQATRN